MSRMEKIGHDGISSDITHDDASSTSKKAFEEVAKAWAIPRKPIANSNDLSEHLIGVEEGILQAGKECIDPQSIKSGLVQTAATLKDAGQYVAEKVSTGNLHDVVKDIQVASKRIKQASQAYLELSSREQGRVIGHDLLPLLAPDALGIIAEAKMLKGASKLLSGTTDLGKAVGEVAAKGANGFGSFTKLDDELTKPPLRLPQVRATDREAIYRSEKSEINSSADSLHTHEREQLDYRLPSEDFFQKLDGVFEELHPVEKEFLARHGIEIIGLKRAVHANKANVSERTLGFYDPKDKMICVAEEVHSHGNWVANQDIKFTVKHELGHAVNVHIDPSGMLISDRPSFVRAYNKDIGKLSSGLLTGLQLSETDLRNSRNEVFAELYAHASGGITKDSRANKIKMCFPRCLEYLRGFHDAV